jgi:hypothetical protein
MDRPKLRKVDRTVLRRGDELLVVLRDPLGIAEPAAFPRGGRAGARHARRPAHRRAGPAVAAAARRMDLSLEEVSALVDELGEAGFLDDDRFRGMWEAARRRFMASEIRRRASPTCSTPSDPAALRADAARRAADPGGRVAAAATSSACCARTSRSRAGPARWSTRPCAGCRPAADLDLSCSSAPITTRAACPSPSPTSAMARRSPRAQSTPRWSPRSSGGCRGSAARSCVTARHEPRARRPDAASRLRRRLPAGAAGAVRPDGPARRRRRDATDAFLATMEHVLEGRRVLWWISAELSHAGPAFGRPRSRPTACQLLAERDLACLDSLWPDGPSSSSQPLPGERRAARPHPSGAAALSTVARLLPVGYRAELVEYLTVRPPGPTRAGSDWSACASMRRSRRRIDDD